ncbi:hypothetical protein ACLK10_02880 [Escherichia coli]
MIKRTFNRASKSLVRARSQPGMAKCESTCAEPTCDLPGVIQHLCGKRWQPVGSLCVSAGAGINGNHKLAIPAKWPISENESASNIKKKAAKDVASVLKIIFLFYLFLIAKYEKQRYSIREIK